MPAERRINARRSCHLCRQRKTRCELPDPSIPDSSNPLSGNLACHRCKTLKAVCIVDDRGRPRRGPKGKHARQSNLHTLEPVQSTPSTIMSNTTLQEVMDQESVQEPSRHEHSSSQTQKKHGPDSSACLDVLGTFDVRSDSAHSPVQTIDSSTRAYSLAYHSRPITLTSAMLCFAYKGVDLDHHHPYLGHLLDETIREALRSSFDQLLILHPYLPSLQSLVDTHSTSPSIENTLLLYLVVFLAALYAQSSPNIQQLRQILPSHIYTLREQVILQMPTTLPTLWALQLSYLFAPFGILPSQISQHPTHLDRLRGQEVAMRFISDKLGILTNTFTLATLYGVESAFDSAELWTWFYQCAFESSQELEEEHPSMPLHLPDAHAHARSFLDATNERLWAMGLLDETKKVRTLGKLAICEKVVRAWIILEGITTMYKILDDIAGGGGEDMLQEFVRASDMANERLEYLDDRLSELLGAYQIDTTEGPGRCWSTYRTVCLAHNIGKVHRAALCSLVATYHMPSSKVTAPPLSDTLHSAFQRSKYAIEQLRNPSAFTAFFTADPPSPALQTLFPIISRRRKSLEQLLSAFSSLDPGDLIPWHHIIALAVDGCNVLMEVQAGSMAMSTQDPKDLHRHFRVHHWTIVKRQITSLMAVLQKSDKSDELRTESLAKSGQSGQSAQTIGEMCGNLVGSMLRVMDGRIQALAKKAHQDTNSNRTTPTPTTTTDPTPSSSADPSQLPSFHLPFLGTMGTGTTDDSLINNQNHTPPISSEGNMGMPIAFDQLFADIFDATYGVPGVIDANDTMFNV